VCVFEGLGWWVGVDFWESVCVRCGKSAIGQPKASAVSQQPRGISQRVADAHRQQPTSLMTEKANDA